MFYILIFIGIAILLVVAFFVQKQRQSGGATSPKPHGTEGASRTPKGSAARRERKRRRAQSSHDRRKRH
jgi:hypothetical protein